MKLLLVLALIIAVAYATRRPSEFVEMPGHTVKENYHSPLPHEYILPEDIPKEWNWADVDGVSYVTKSLNQHLPQYCGSCWAHGALSSLADRIKIARKAQGDDVNLAVQYILNCGRQIAGSCNGGSATGTFEFVQKSGFVPYDTCLQYEACSADSGEAGCQSGNYECNAMNTCRTCNTFTSSGGFCAGVSTFPNATIAEYGTVSGAAKMQAEIYARGPIAAGVDANPLIDYTGGIVENKSFMVDHIVSITGWGYDNATDTSYWIVRNSWGQYWGEMGYFRVRMGQNDLGLESSCSWATPGTWTEVNFPCYEDGTNCVTSNTYTDPSVRFHNSKEKFRHVFQE